MAEKQEGFWGRHFTGIIQCAFGLYCSIFATLSYFLPRPVPVALGTPAAPPAGAAMNVRYSMPFWLWVGIVGLVLSVVVPALVKMVRGRKEPQRKPEGTFLKEQAENNRALQEEMRKLTISHNAELSRCIEIRDQYGAEKREAEAKLKIFTPLQMEALQLAKSLHLFAEESGETPDSTKKYSTAEEYEAFVMDREFIRGSWLNTFRSRYREKFGNKVAATVNRLGCEGVHREFLDGFVRGDAKDAADVQLAGEFLISSAHELDQIYVFPAQRYTAQQIEAMAQDELYRRLGEEPGFAETWQRYQQHRLNSGSNK